MDSNEAIAHCRSAKCSRPAATKALRVLEAADVLHALDDRKKNRAVVFKEYLDHLREGTEVTA